MIFTLVADGSADVVLLPLITWSLKQQGVSWVLAQWADQYRMPRTRTTEQRLRLAIELYPCDVLFVHRDAEGQAPNLRREEIARALRYESLPHIPVIPVRMTEAWLLGDEKAIRLAAGNPNGIEDLNLPDIRRLESIPDPKSVLHQALMQASNLNARRRSGFPVRQRIHFIPNYIDDYSHLNVLPAFQALQRDIRSLVSEGPAPGGFNPSIR